MIKVLRCGGHARLCPQALSPVINVLPRGRWGRLEVQTGLCEDRGRDWSHVTTSQRHAGNAGGHQQLEGEQRFPPEPLEGGWPHDGPVSAL